VEYKLLDIPKEKKKLSQYICRRAQIFGRHNGVKVTWKKWSRVEPIFLIIRAVLLGS
jgi:hypothetical protein